MQRFESKQQEVFQLNNPGVSLGERSDDGSFSEQSSSDVENVQNDAVTTPKQAKNYAKRLSTPPIANFWDVLSLGICLTASNLTFTWSIALSKGFWTFFFTTVIISSVFICLHLCIAEMSSILPFSGGTYGFVRVTVGPYCGFLVGCFETIGGMIFTMVGVIILGHYITYTVKGDVKYEPIYWLVLYMLIIINEFSGRKYYFKMLNLVAIAFLCLFVFYIIVSSRHIDVGQYLPTNSINDSFRGGMDDFFHVMPFSAFFYFGMEMIPLVSDEVKNPRRETPKAIVGTLFFITSFAFLFMFLVFCQYPSYPYNNFGFAVQHLWSLNSAFRNEFQITDRAATAISYLTLFYTVSIFTFGFSKQMKAMGKSKLLPAFLGKTFENTNIPYNALLVGCIISYIVLLFFLFSNQSNIFTSSVISNLYVGTLIGTFSSHFLTFISYIIFKRKYPNLERCFHNPLGIYSAAYGLIVMSIFLIVLIGFITDQFYPIQIYAAFVLLVSLYYYFFARDRQIFSDEEQKILFIVYLMKGNWGNLFDLIFSKFFIFLFRFL
jgi:ethanolamine permease